MFQNQSSERVPFVSPVAIAVAPNGGRRTKADHLRLPMEPAELAWTAAACRDAGAAMIHLHVRDAAGRHLLDAAAYRDAIRAVQAEVGEDLVIQITSESLGLYSSAEQRAVVEAVRPEAVSLALRELLPEGEDERTFADFLQRLADAGVAVQFILYDESEARRLAALQQRGVVPFAAVSVLYVLGRYTPGQVSRPEDLAPFLAPDMPRFPVWMTCAFGRNEAACVLAGARAGGGVRVGFENNLWLPDGSLAPDNAALVQTVATAMAGAGIERMTTASLRRAWGIE
ncbi:3-keto-5-aminohexanoate cleavage protein [Opitutaceae bacterium]